MKNVIQIVCFLLLFIEPLGAVPIKFHWEPIDKTFDSIVNKLESGFIYDDKTCYRDTLINQLYTLAREHPQKPIYQWRAEFWDARSQLKKNNADSTIVLINKARQKVDSVHYTYDYIRIFHLWTIMHKEEKAHIIYKNLKTISEYYAKTNDLFMQAHAYIDIGNILGRLKDYPKAFEYLQKADSYYKKLNEENYQAKNQLNLSNILYLMNEKEHADIILNKLLKNPICVKDTSFYINTLLSLADHDISQSKKLITQAYRLSIVFANKGLLIQSESFMGDFHLTENRADSALHYYRKAYQRTDVRNTDLIVPVLKNLSKCFSILHQPDSAYSYLNKYEIYKDSLEQMNSLAEIRRIESRAAIEKQELELRQTEERSQFHFILTSIICTFIVCIAILICYIFWKRQREEKIKRQLKELENKELSTRMENETLQKDYFKVMLASKDRALTSNSLIIMEKNEILHSLIYELEKEKETGNINPTTVIQICSHIKAHLGTENEWDFFKTQFVKVHPDFFIKLKIYCPSITENELRLCALLRTGMENKHIAHMLSLQPDSVKKNRYRLRLKLNIIDQESLENFLRNF